MNYAVMVCINGTDDWIYVTDVVAGNGYDLNVKLFETEDEALYHAEIWRKPGHPECVRVVEYV